MLFLVSFPALSQILGGCNCVLFFSKADMDAKLDVDNGFISPLMNMDIDGSDEMCVYVHFAVGCGILSFI